MLKKKSGDDGAAVDPLCRKFLRGRFHNFERCGAERFLCKRRPLGAQAEMPGLFTFSRCGTFEMRHGECGFSRFSRVPFVSARESVPYATEKFTAAKRFGPDGCLSLALISGAFDSQSVSIHEAQSRWAPLNRAPVVRPRPFDSERPVMSLAGR